MLVPNGKVPASLRQQSLEGLPYIHRSDGHSLKTPNVCALNSRDCFYRMGVNTSDNHRIRKTAKHDDIMWIWQVTMMQLLDFFKILKQESKRRWGEEIDSPVKMKKTTPQLDQHC